MAASTTVSALAQLRAFSECVADTADFGEVKALGAQDSTTNPSLLLKASEMKAYEPLVTDAVTYAVARASSPAERVSLAMDKLSVNFGAELLKIVPGVVSTEVDARLSFDTERSIAKGRAIIELYKQAGVDSKRVLVKLASTWEGLQASKVLEKEGIRTNMTLLFALPQAVAAAEAGSYLISPFVGRIYDWWIKNGVAKDVPSLEDPGVKSVTNIYQYLKSHGYPTIVMGASFRNVGQIKALAGCDKLTISPQLLKELAQPAAADAAPLTRYLNLPASEVSKPAVALDEATFRWQMNEDAMATEKLAEGIRLFAADCVKLEKALTARVQAHVTATASA